MDKMADPLGVKNEIYYFYWKKDSESNVHLNFYFSNTLIAISFQKKTTQHLSSVR